MKTFMHIRRWCLPPATAADIFVAVPAVALRMCVALREPGLYAASSLRREVKLKMVNDNLSFWFFIYIRVDDYRQPEKPKETRATGPLPRESGMKLGTQALGTTTKRVPRVFVDANEKSLKP
uniref:Uncharacterized protein n=1 Tax=Ixodes ricinus TaxID=34613 RepID=A0A6B0UN88_IXORI